jgi:hypothetical protein
MGDDVTTIQERRSHPRQVVETAVRCRRLGRSGFDQEVETLDLSPGGTLLLADRRLGVGDVLRLEFHVDDVSVAVQGMVVGVRDAPFKGIDARYVHVAFTSLSPERLDALSRVLDTWQSDDDIA